MAKKLVIGTTRVFDEDGIGQVAQGLGAGDDVEFENITCNDISVSDLIMSNDRPNHEGNDIDGTKGSWVIQEGENDIFVINKKTGKQYKLALNEV
ncbi:uncharacterized protein METZ01_LOCUS164595 [marine metagenome]|uniref:Uncharacterized protein n=1 Tax=marine metagenome TaxID=408172 RepID=A0A382BDZ6_9ZZZZ|tara:strand:+ start:380 stop:664 length:285 start_codon:yes stop_codon:yes gene_type:complete